MILKPLTLATALAFFGATISLPERAEAADHHAASQKSASGEKSASESFAFWPGAKYDPAVPTLEKIIGHKNGAEITTPEEAVRYMQALARAYPNRVKLYEYARTWEDRPLVYAAIGSADNIAKLKTLQDGMHALSDPRETDDAKAKGLIDTLPATVWIAYGVHGNEISSTDAALMTA